MKTSFISRLATFTFAAVLFAGTLPVRAELEPLTRVHAHNDYEHKHPLFDALKEGFCSVEADINLTNGQLLVAHNLKETDPKKTLQSLYLEPLRQRIRENNGKVYPNGPDFILLIDFKTDAKPTYEALRTVLKDYSDIICTFHDGVRDQKPITVILTGNYPRDLLAADTTRYAAGDGKLPDLEKNPPATLVPWISENWKSVFKWNGKGEIPPDEDKKLKSIIERAHEQGRKVRFWNSPDKPDFWKELLEHGVDLINTDDLPGFRHFYLGN